jgi:hypothetical protein
MPMFSRFDLTVGSLSAVAVSMWIFSTIARDVSAMLERAKRASHVDPPASSYAIMRRAGPYRGENPGPGKDVEGELEPRPGIREQPGSKARITALQQ